MISHWKAHIKNQNPDKNVENDITGNWVAGHEGLGQVDRVRTSSLFWCSAAKVVLTINYTLILEVILISVFKINSKNLLSSTLPKIQDQHSNQGGSVCRGEQPWWEEQGRQQRLQHQGRRVQVVRDDFASGVIFWQISSIDQAQVKKGFWLVCKNIGVKEISHEVGDAKKN